jgi:hypothetical protein
VGTSEIVQAPAAGDAARTPGEEVAGGLLGNYGIRETLADESFAPLGNPLALALLFTPPAGFLIALVLALRNRRLTGDPLLLRERNALVTARAALDEARAQLSSGDEAAATAAFHRALTGYVAARGRVPSAGMTAADVRARFEACGVAGDVGEAVVVALAACEAARYGGGSADLAQRIQAAAGWLAALEREALR